MLSKLVILKFEQEQNSEEISNLNENILNENVLNEKVSQKQIVK